MNMNLIKIEEVKNFDSAWVNPAQIAGITRHNEITRIHLVGGISIETDWTPAKTIAALNQVVYDSTNDPDLLKEGSLVKQLKDALISIKNAGVKKAVKVGNRLFNCRVSENDVIVPINYKFSAVVNISEYITTDGGTQTGVDLKIGPAKQPFSAPMCAHYGIPALKDLDFTVKPTLAGEFDPALLECLVGSLKVWAGDVLIHED